MKKWLGIAAVLAGMLAVPFSRADEPPGTFVAVGQVFLGRLGASSTLLADGRVLVAGGGYSGSLRQAELYDPQSRSFTPTGYMAQARSYHTATRLADGRVLIVGFDSTYAAELYDPATGLFRRSGRIGAASQVHAAVLLHDGRVLIVADTHAELYDPKTDTFRRAGAYAFSYLEYLHTATPLADGRVLIVGEGRAQVYDPARDAFSATQPPCRGECGIALHSATLLEDGNVLLAGGVTYIEDDSTDAAFLYQPALGTWRPIGNMRSRRASHAAVRLANGHVLFVGGWAKSCLAASVCSMMAWQETAEVYDPSRGAFLETGHLAMARNWPQATLLQDGDVLVTGWASVPPELYQPGKSAPPNDPATLVEYRSLDRDAFILLADPAERAHFEDGNGGRWARTGAMFTAFASPQAGTRPACRFFWKTEGTAVLSFFHTVDAAECEHVKRDPGWAYAGTPFHAVPLENGACPPPLRVLWRAYNNGWPRDAPNHRYSTDREVLDAMILRGWSVEGPAMCVQ
jgi:hypothetical protein